MLTIVGKAFKDSNPIPGAHIQAFIYDPANDISHWTGAVTTDTDGRYQLSLDSILPLHRSLSKTAEIVVAGWEGDQNRLATHDYLGTSIHRYDGEALSIIDVNLLASDMCGYELVNNAINVNVNESVPYRPVFEARDQLASFHGETVFPQNTITNVYMLSGDTYVSPYDIIYYQEGSYSIPVRGVNVVGTTADGVVTVNAVGEMSSDEFSIDEVVIDSALAMLVVNNRGIKDNTLSGSIYAANGFSITRAEIWVDGDLRHEKTDFSTPLVSVSLPETTEETREVKLVAFGTVGDDIEEVSYESTQTVKDYSTITGTVSVSFDPNTGLHTAAVGIDNPTEVAEILWQIVYHSTVVQRVISVSGADEKALINIIYQDYVDPSNTSIEFETLHPGNYTIVAYAINSAGVYFKMSEDLFVPGGEDDVEDLNVGDSITIGCLSNHGEVPILTINRLSRDGYVEEAVVPMEHAFDKTYFYDYTIQSPDSFYIFQAADSLLVKKVGVPRGCVVAYAKKKDTGRTIPYSLADFNGNEIASGTLDDSGLGMYYKVLPETAHGVLSIGNSYKVI